MPYVYEGLKPSLFTEEGMAHYTQVRDRVKCLLADSGAFKAGSVLIGDTWLSLACLDYMVERGELVELERPGGKKCWAQHRVFTDGRCYG